MPQGSRTLRAAGGHPGGDGGEGDSTGGPSPEREGIGRWPTLVIKAGDSESLRQLEADMRWWFDKSNHDVKIVLLAKFDRRSSRIILQKWEEETPSARTGATTTRRPPPLQPVLRQEITISRDQSTDPLTYNVARGVLVLGFRLLFLRDPGLQDGDFVISIEDLERYARAVWTYVD
ncbi:hypothetical protein IMZ48_21750 [Candidatus Bathyarchaeota archaeon]|nr:hypothetical protein [Candidatus Bathyarchaeota archaeon]